MRSRLLTEQEKRLDYVGRMLESLSFKNVLKRGYVVVRDENNKPLTAAEQARTGQSVQLEFYGDQRVDAIIGKGGKGNNNAKTAKTSENPKGTKEQGKLF